METRLLELLALKIQGEISDLQQTELDILLRDFPQYRELARQLPVSPEDIEELRLMGTLNTRKDWEKITGRYTKKLRTKKRIRIASTVAAACCLFIGLWYMIPGHQTPVEPTAPASPLHGVVLELADGRTIAMTEKSYTVAQRDTTNSKPLPVADQHIADQPRHNKLYVPKGCDFYIILADNTRVWLNADSRLEYPSIFPPDRREIYLEGEAYFEVAKENGKPFIVKTKSLDVQVTGTSFNVTAYPDEASVLATLLEGSVNVMQGEQPLCALRPGEQCVLNCASGNWEVNRVNPQSFIAWKSGQFFFDNQSIENIMHTLARWYNVQVVFENQELKTELFYGTIPRADQITQVLDMLVLTKTMTYEIKENIVYIRQ